MFKRNKTVCDHPQLKQRSVIGRFTVVSTVLVLFSIAFVGLFIAGVHGDIGVFEWVREVAVLRAVYRFIYELRALPLLIIGLPFLGSVAMLWFGRNSCNGRDSIVIAMTSLTILLTVFTYPHALEGGFAYSIPGVFGLGLSFNVDMLGFTMLMVTSVIWFLVMVYAHEYMKKEFNCNRFFFFMGITYGAVLGTIVAGDLLTLFLFFEIMTFASYILVIHGQKEDSYHAGYSYIFMGIIGGFAILVAMLLLYFTVGDLAFDSAIAALSQHGSARYWIIGLLIFGFGIKAGMAPVHVWLPRAHPVAPTPASALLSGIMIKLGAYGILRIAVSYYFPPVGTDGGDALWLTSQTIGSAVIWIGIVTMAIGVFLALQQANIKRMLAYHSISQMGYIVMGIGVAMYLGHIGAMGYAGAIYHIINHALFKSLLFMVAGVVFYHTGESDMYKLGGLWRKLPLTATVCLIASLGIAGIPLFNGFISKTILHHGIVEAYQYGHPTFFYAELIFIVISAGTVASFIKLFYYVFLRKMPARYRRITPEYNNLDTAMAMMALIIVYIGLNPRFVLDTFIIPQFDTLAYSADFVQTYVVGLTFFTAADLWLMLGIVVFGFIIFIGGKRWHLFHLKLPYWMSVEYFVFYPMNWIIKNACRLMYGDECKYNDETITKLRLKDNKDIGFLDRFMIMATVFNTRFEKRIIRSDAFIYTVFVTGVLLMMLVMRLV